MENNKPKEIEIKQEEKTIVCSSELPRWIEILKEAYEEYQKNGKI